MTESPVIRAGGKEVSVMHETCKCGFLMSDTTVPNHTILRMFHEPITNDDYLDKDGIPFFIENAVTGCTSTENSFGYSGWKHCSRLHSTIQKQDSARSGFAMTMMKYSKAISIQTECSFSYSIMIKLLYFIWKKFTRMET